MRVPYGILQFYQLLVRHYLKKRNIAFDGCPTFVGLWPRFRSAGRTTLGSKVLFRAPRLRQHFTVTTPEGRLEIGDRVFLNDGVNICAAEQITIEEDCKLGDEVIIYDTSFHPVDENGPVTVRPVILERNVWIGARCVILPGVTIGAHSVVGAGAVVVNDILPRTVAAGIPARPIRSIQCSDEWRRP